MKSFLGSHGEKAGIIVGSIVGIIIVVFIIAISLFFFWFKPYVFEKRKICDFHKNNVNNCNWLQQYRTCRYWNKHQNGLSAAKFSRSSNVEAANRNLLRTQNEIVELLTTRQHCRGCEPEEGRILPYLHILECRLN